MFFCCAQLSGSYLKIAFFKKRVQKLGFSIFCALSLKFENSLFYLCETTIKIGVSASFGVFFVFEREERAKK